MTKRRLLLFGGVAATLLIAVWLLVGNLSPKRRPVPTSTKVEGLSPSEAEIVYDNACQVMSANCRLAIGRAEFGAALTRFFDRYFADIQSLTTNSDGTVRVFIQTRWPGTGGAQMIMNLPAPRPEKP